MVKYLSFHNSSFALRYLFNVIGKAPQCDTPLAFPWVEVPRGGGVGAHALLTD